MQLLIIAENLTLSACNEKVRSMLGESAEKEFFRVLLLNNLLRRIDDMSSDVQKSF